jgi:hypothetical protein
MMGLLDIVLLQFGQVIWFSIFFPFMGIKLFFSFQFISRSRPKRSILSLAPVGKLFSTCGTLTDRLLEQ